MSLIVNDLRDELLTVRRPLDLGEKIANYIMGNAVIDFSWVAVLPPPASTPDPIIVAKGEILSLIILTPPSMATTFNDMVGLTTAIRLGFTIGTYNITDAGFSTTPALFGATPPLTIDMMGGEETITKIDLGLTDLQFSSLNIGSTVSYNDLTYNVISIEENISISAKSYACSQELAMTRIAEQVIEWVKSIIPIAPCSGSHASYIGAGTATKIS